MRILPTNLSKISFNSDNVLRYSSVASLLISWLVTMPILSALPGASLLFWGSRILSLYTVYDMGLRISLKDITEKLQNISSNLFNSSKTIENSTTCLDTRVAELTTQLEQEKRTVEALGQTAQRLTGFGNVVAQAAQAETVAASTLAEALNAMQAGRVVGDKAASVNSEFERLAAELMRGFVST